jgi:hypothetical protein
MRLFYKIFSYILSFPMLLYTIEKGIFDSTLYFYAYTAMLTVLIFIMFLYFLAYITVFRKFKFVKNFIEGQQESYKKPNKKQKTKFIIKYRRSTQL